MWSKENTGVTDEWNRNWIQKDMSVKIVCHGQGSVAEGQTTNLDATYGWAFIPESALPEDRLKWIQAEKGFKKLFTRTPYDYHLEIKMKEAKQLLLDPESSIYMVAYQVGYQHVSNFCIQFKKRFGVTPLRFKVNNGS